MVKNKDESQECIEKKLKDKKKGGYRELKDPLLGKGKRHSAAALKKDADIISNEVAVVPSGEHKEDTVTAGADFEKTVGDMEKVPAKDKEKIKETVTLRFENSEKFLKAAFEFNPNLPLDFDEDSFIVAVSKEKLDTFRGFMSEKGIEELPFTETDRKIAEVQSMRSNRALKLDNSKKATKIASREDEKHLSKWLKNPSLSDVIGVDDGEN
jgi:hypothetical protein